MLFDEKLIYSEISKEEFEKNRDYYYIDSSYVKASVVCYYKNKSNNKIIKFVKTVDNNDVNDKIDNDNYELIVKYYVIEIVPDLPISLDLEDVGISTHIYNIGYYEISNYIDCKNINHNIEEKIKEYDINFKNIKFPFTDEEFINENTYRNGSINPKIK